MQAPFVDPRPLYETEAPLSTRVGVFGRHLVVDATSQRVFDEVTRRIIRRSPIVDIGCGVGAPLLPVGPTVLDRQDVNTEAQPKKYTIPRNAPWSLACPMLVCKTGRTRASS